MNNMQRFHDETVKLATDAGLLVYPSTPLGDSMLLTEPWSDNLAGFVDIAARAGAKIMYVEIDTFRIDDEIPVDIDEDDERVPPLLRAARLHEDEPCVFTASWVCAGVEHGFQVRADWLHEIRSAVAELEHTSDEDSSTDSAYEITDDDRILTDEDRQRAREIAEDSDFEKHRVHRYRIAVNRWPELPRRKLYAIVREATALYEIEVLPRRNRELAVEAKQLRVRGMSKTAIAARLNIGQTRLNQLLELDES